MPAQEPAIERDELLRAVKSDVLARDAEYCHYRDKAARLEAPDAGPSPDGADPSTPGLTDYWFASGDEPLAPDEVFARLRWGGQVVYASRDAAQVEAAAAAFAKRGFALARPPGYVRQRYFGLRLPFVGRKVHYLIGRKVFLTRPREISDRFTYHLQLVPEAQKISAKAPRESGGSPASPAGAAPVRVVEPAAPRGGHPRGCDAGSAGGGYVVLKEVPSVERVIARLEARFPEAPPDVIVKRARKFTEKIFPIFLTREAAMLQILERDLPPAFANRVPRLIDMEQDDRGYVRKLRMNWLRNDTAPGGRPLSQAQFATQAAELLHVLHDRVGIIHLDLRLDNVVVTEHGVGFVDFGSSVRVGEDLASNTLLNTLFEELMRTSEIQRMLERMTLTGSVTSPIISQGYQKVDKAVDFFYLALQINTPLTNPDFRGLVRFDPKSDEARAIKRVTDEVLRPRDLKNPKFRSAKDLLRGIRELTGERGTAA